MSCGFESRFGHYQKYPKLSFWGIFDSYCSDSNRRQILKKFVPSKARGESHTSLKYIIKWYIVIFMPRWIKSDLRHFLSECSEVVATEACEVWKIRSIFSHAEVAKLVDALALGASTARYGGSSPLLGTRHFYKMHSNNIIYFFKK